MQEFGVNYIESQQLSQVTVSENWEIKMIATFFMFAHTCLFEY